MNVATALRTKKTLYLQILPFHIGAYVSDKSYGGRAEFPEDYSHDKSHYYLIVQPMLRVMKDEGGTRLRADLSDSPGLVEYLTATSWEDLQIMVLPPAKIASDQAMRAQVKSAGQALLNMVDGHLAAEFAKQGKAAGQRSKAMTELAAFGFEHVKAHFHDDSNAKLFDPLRVKFADYAKLAAPDYIPVPFPPDTSMALDFLLGKPGTATAVTIDTHLSATTPEPGYLKLSVDQWADFCAYNFIQREKENWAQLDTDEQQQFREWAQGVYTALASALKTNGEFDPNAAVNAELKIAWDRFFKTAELVLANPPTDNTNPRDRWTKWITTTVIPASGLVADEFLFGFLRDGKNFGSDSPYYEHTPRLQFPRYFSNGKKLALHLKAALADPAIAAAALTTYHANFWDGFAKEATAIKALSPREAATKEGVLGNRIAAAMVFGERLRMPRPPKPFDNRHILELKAVADDIDAPNWLVTCNQSLLGQAFRLGPLEDHPTDAAIELKELKFKLKDQASFTNVFPAAQLGAINAMFAGLVTEARSYRSGGTSTVKMTIDADPGHPGRIHFERQMFNVARIKVDAPVSKVAGADAVLFGIPSALLDAVEPSLAFDASVSSVQIREVNARRQLFPVGRLSNELGQPPWSQLRWLARVPVLLRKSTLGAYRREDLFEFALSADLNEDEFGLYSAAFERLVADQGTHVHADLWQEIADSTTTKFEGIGSLEGALILALQSRRLNGKTHAVGCQLQLRGDALTKASAWLAGPGPNTAGPTELAVTLVLDARLLDGHFNLLAAPPGLAEKLDADQLIPRALFNFKPAIGVDGIMERFSLAVDGPSKTVPPPALAPSNDKFLCNMLDSFTKARFFLCPSADVAVAGQRRDFWLSYPAALLPLKENGGARDDLAKYRPAKVSSGRAYWVTQHFTAPAKTAAQHGIGDQAVNPEDRRYLVRAGGAGIEWHLGATVENPFGIRLGASIARDFKLGYAAPVSNLAAVGVPTKKAPNAVVTLPFLNFMVSDQDATHKKLVLTLDKKAIMASLGAGPSLRSPEDQTVLEAGPKTLRTLYECLCDLRDASAAASGVRLIFEAWRFDGNTVAADAPVAQLPADHQEFPAIVAGLCKVPLPRNGVLQLTKTDLERWLKALAPTYSGFLAALNTMVTPTAVTAIELSVETGSAPELRQTLLYRVGLELNRPVAALVPCPPAADGFVVIKPDDAGKLAYAKHCAGGAVERGVVGGLSLEASGVLLEDAAGNAEQDAHDEFLRLTTQADSPWRKNNAWLFPSEDSAPANAVPARTLGDIAAKVQVLAALGKIIPKQRAELYYILYGFVPLGAVASDTLKLDAATTYQFGHYVAEVLGSVLRGDAVRLATLIGIDIDVDVGKPGADPVLAAAIRAGAAPLAAHFAGSVSQYWMDTVHHPINSTATQTMALAKGYGAQYRACIASLLEKDPSMYATAKGVAVGAFKPGDFPDQLAYLQICKHILKLDASGKKALANPGRINTERFPVMQIQSCPAVPNPLAPHNAAEHRYFVDVLEDALYGDFFEIPAPAGGAQFGAVLARSAADYLSDSNRFDEAPSQVVGARALELTVKHEETAWRVDSKAVYVLPARKPPTTPMPVLPLVPGRLSSAWRDLYGRRNVADASLEAAFERIFFNTPGTTHPHFPAELALEEAEGKEATKYRRDTSGKFPLSICGSKHMPKGWHHVDTSCAHFYFLVDSSEENTIDLDQFNLELIRRPLRDQGSRKQLSAMVVPAGLDELIKWHTYYLSKERNTASSPQVAPAKMPHGLLNPALKAAIDLLWPAPQSAVAQAPDPVERISVTLKRNSAGWSLSEIITTEGTWKSGLDGVIGVDVLATGNSRQVLLHFAVVHQPWSTLEGTLGVQRNLLDLDQKNGPDINERFVMASDLSDLVWVDPSALSIDFHQEKMFDSALRTLTNVEHDVSVWLDATRTAPDTAFPFGTAFANNFHKLSLKKFNSAFPELPVWNETKLRDASFMVEGRADYVDRELGPRSSSAQADRTALAVVPEREDAKVRSFLTANGDETSRRVTASDAEKLMFLYPGEVRTPWPNIQLTWSYGTGEHSRQSLLQVTIPLRWKQHKDQLHHASTASIIHGEIE